MELRVRAKRTAVLTSLKRFFTKHTRDAHAANSLVLIRAAHAHQVSLEMVSSEATIALPALPVEIQQEILLRLPLLSFWTCRSVCRSWATFIEAFIFRTLFLNQKMQLQLHEHRIYRGGFQISTDPRPRAHNRVEDNMWLVFPLPASEHDKRFGLFVETGYHYCFDEEQMATRVCSLVRHVRVIYPGQAIKRKEEHALYICMRLFWAPEGRVNAPRVRYEKGTCEVWVDWRALMGAVVRDQRWGGQSLWTLCEETNRLSQFHKRMRSEETRLIEGQGGEPNSHD